MLSGYLKAMRPFHFLAYFFYCYYCYQSYPLDIAVRHAMVLFVCWYALEGTICLFFMLNQMAVKKNYTKRATASLSNSLSSKRL